MSKPDVRSNVWRVVSDGDFPMIVHADDFAEVMSFIGYNASELMGAPTMAHVNLQIDQLWESEVEAMYAAARQLSASTAHLGKILGVNGEPFVEELKNLNSMNGLSDEDKDDIIDAVFNQAQKEVDLDNEEARLL